MSFEVTSRFPTRRQLSPLHLHRSATDLNRRHQQKGRIIEPYSLMVEPGQEGEYSANQKNGISRPFVMSRNASGARGRRHQRQSLTGYVSFVHVCRKPSH